MVPKRKFSWLSSYKQQFNRENTSFASILSQTFTRLALFEIFLIYFLFTVIRLFCVIFFSSYFCPTQSCAHIFTLHLTAIPIYASCLSESLTTSIARLCYTTTNLLNSKKVAISASSYDPVILFLRHIFADTQGPNLFKFFSNLICLIF